MIVREVNVVFIAIIIVSGTVSHVIFFCKVNGDIRIFFSYAEDTFAVNSKINMIMNNKESTRACSLLIVSPLKQGKSPMMVAAGDKFRSDFITFPSVF